MKEHAVKKLYSCRRKCFVCFSIIQQHQIVVGGILELVDVEWVEIRVVNLFSRARLVFGMENEKAVWELFTAWEHFLEKLKVLMWDVVFLILTQI